MKPVVVSEVLAVGEFPTAEQIAILAKAGFKSILNNQPDGEVERFPSAAEVEAEARRHGLGYAYAPLTSRTPSRGELAGYGAAVGSLPSPIYAFCYSGSRSAAGCALLLTEDTAVDRIIADFAEAGFDIETLRPWLDEERARHECEGRKVVNAAKTEPAVKAGPAGAPAVNGTNGHHAGSGNGNGAVVAKPAASPSGTGATAKPAALPRMVVVQPRAAGFGGFAI